MQNADDIWADDICISELQRQQHQEKFFPAMPMCFVWYRKGHLLAQGDGVDWDVSVVYLWTQDPPGA